MLKSYQADKLDASAGTPLTPAGEYVIPRRDRSHPVTDETVVDTATPRDHQEKSAPAPGYSTRVRGGQRTGTLGGSNRLLSSREVAVILAIPERTVRDKWREWGLPAYRIGKHLQWRERDVYAWIERQSA